MIIALVIWTQNFDFFTAVSVLGSRKSEKSIKFVPPYLYRTGVMDKEALKLCLERKIGKLSSGRMFDFPQ